MNRSEIVSLLQKNIEELVLITKGFAQMDIYPQAILDLARNKTADINQYIEMLAGNNPVNKEVETLIPLIEEPITNADDVVEQSENPEITTEQETIANESIENPVLDEIENKESSESIPEEVIQFSETPKEDAPEKNTEETLNPDLEEATEDDTEEPVEEVEVEENIIEDQFKANEEEEEVKDTHIGIEIIHPVEIEDVVEMNITTPVEDKKIISESQKTKTLGEKLSGNQVSRLDALNKPANGQVHSSISNLKISDIRQAISLGDRFRFQRELFRNNGEEMNKMLSYLNMLATYEEAVAFLFSKYGWDEESPAVNDFLQIIKRKF